MSSADGLLGRYQRSYHVDEKAEGISKTFGQGSQQWTSSSILQRTASFQPSSSIMLHSHLPWGGGIHVPHSAQA